MPADKMMGARIKALRRDCGMTQGQLAMLLGNDGNTVSRWERGEIGIGNKYLKELAVIFHVSVDYLLTGTAEERARTGYTERPQNTIAEVVRPQLHIAPQPQTAEISPAPVKTEDKPDGVKNVIEKARRERVGFDYWGVVVEVTRAVAERGDSSEIEDAVMMLDKALSNLNDALKKTAARAALRQSVLPAPSAGESSEAVAV